jgi:hypothetical protein
MPIVPHTIATHAAGAFGSPRYLWHLSRSQRYDEAGDDPGDVSSLVQQGQFAYSQATAKGTLSGQLYGDTSKLGQLAQQGCGGSDVSSLRACQEKQEAAGAAAVGAFIGTLGTAISGGNPLVGAVLSAAWGYLVKNIGFAEAGYGTCDGRSSGDQSYVVDPTSDWRTWPYQFFEGDGRAGFYPKPIIPPTPGTFEAFAETIIRANFASLHNCAPPCDNPSPDGTSNACSGVCGTPPCGLPPALALAQAIAAWNSTHSSSQTRTITRNNFNSGVRGGFQSGVYDEADGIGDAIGWAFQDLVLPPRSPVSFTINDGPALHTIHLTSLKGLGQKFNFSGAVIAKAPAAKTSSPVTTAVLVGGAGVLALAFFKPALLRNVPLLKKLPPLLGKR